MKERIIFSGDNSYGQLGIERSQSPVGTSPNDFPPSVVGLGVLFLFSSPRFFDWIVSGIQVRAVNAAWGHVCAIGYGGTLYCWGIMLLFVVFTKSNLDKGIIRRRTGTRDGLGFECGELRRRHSATEHGPAHFLQSHQDLYWQYSFSHLYSV